MSFQSELRQILGDLASQCYNIGSRKSTDPADLDGSINEAQAAITALVVRRLPEKLELLKDETDTDYFYGYGWNAAIDRMVATIGGDSHGDSEGRSETASAHINQVDNPSPEQTPGEEQG